LETVVVAITGAAGTLIPLILLKKLKQKMVKTALIVSEAAYRVAEIELNINPTELDRLADMVVRDEAQIADLTPKAMIIAPCSMKSLAGVAWERRDNLVLKAAKQMLEKKLPLILVVRETPWSIIHLRNMLRVSMKGAIVMPPVLQPKAGQKSIDEFVDNLADKIVELCI
jgi:polyprenyl P-hydroxybenzoate/phenylacrylic acid decarboxylase-like protein